MKYAVKSLKKEAVNNAQKCAASNRHTHTEMLGELSLQYILCSPLRVLYLLMCLDLTQPSVYIVLPIKSTLLIDVFRFNSAFSIYCAPH